MALINREQALSHPFANGQYDKEHADEHFIMGFEDYKEWLEDLPTVEAIPKDQHEARLKADMVAMLTEIQLEIEELPTNRMAITDSSGLICYGYSEYEPTAKDASKIIQQKIDKLRGE